MKYVDQNIFSLHTFSYLQRIIFIEHIKNYKQLLHFSGNSLEEWMNN